MPWWQLSIQCSKEELQHTEEILLELGALSLSIADAGDEPIYEPLPGDQPLWAASIVTGLFDQANTPESLYDALSPRLPGHQVATLRTTLLEDQQWERVFLERFKPMRFGENVWVCPSWTEPPDPQACNIILDPGIAFGTGTHPTTTLCLEYLDRNPPIDKVVMDYGCGSGILAIAAARLGAKAIHAVDIDPQALNATRDNIERNQLDPSLFQLTLPQRGMSIHVDYLMANILSGPLIDLEPLFARITQPGARLVLSGILQEQADDVSQCYAQHFQLDAVTIKNQWCRITGVRQKQR